MIPILIGVMIAVVLGWALYKVIIYYYMDYVHPFHLLMILKAMRC